ncbi:Uncharacterized protein FWK35_00001907 [Aphis craccivora]|uniref:Uncharacterized protein n=1 Tax=Aphis craccivora TaxID=307492 RepID=A0A6G0ZN39_APHCR|nr:Uncharacterized protein FWK35_00001907 [Aphis craccivora]
MNRRNGCVKFNKFFQLKIITLSIHVVFIDLLLSLRCHNHDFSLCLDILDSERRDEYIDFTMIITSRNNAPISNCGGGFRCKSEYPWCIIGIKSKHFQTVFKNIEKNKNK